LDAHGKAAYECPSNAGDEVTLAAKLNAHDKAAYKCPVIT